MMRNGHWKISIAALVLSTMCIACAPQFIDIQKPIEHKSWVQREAMVTSDQLGPSRSEEIVLAAPAAVVISSEERVRWVSGVDLAKSRLQRAHQRIASTDGDLLRGTARSDMLVDIHKFEVIGDRLSVEGQLLLERFKASSNGRYYVEFLGKGPMTEEGVRSMTEAWRAISPRLKERGLNTSSVVMGGSKYDQAVNAIVLVKVGK